MDTGLSLKGRVALVTGAGQGIGRKIAMHLAEAGAKVIVNDILGKAKAVADEIRNCGNSAYYSEFDVSNEQEVMKAISGLISDLGSIDILVNNAGLTTNRGRTAEMSSDAWRLELEINLTGPFLCSKAVIPTMIDRRWGRIINISSIAGLSGLYGSPGYSATKAGLIGLTRTISLENIKYGITCNAICPGFIEKDVPSAVRPDILERMIRRIPHGKRGKMEDVAWAVHFLASDAAGYISGAVLVIDAGTTLLSI